MRARTVYRISAAGVGVLCVVNIAVVVWLFFSMRRPVNYNVRLVQPALSLPSASAAPLGRSSNTNILGGAGVIRSFASPQLSATNAPGTVYNHGYYYYECASRPYIRMHGRTYALGSGCAYGRIVAIFPEFVLIDDGSRINNLALDEIPEYSRTPFVASNIEKGEIKNNESISN